MLCSTHQSNRFLKMCSMILHITENRAKGLKEVVELALGMGITLKTVYEWRILLRKIILFRTFIR